MSRLVVLTVLTLLLLLTVWLIAEASEVSHESTQVKTVAQWGEVKPWFVIEEPTTTTTVRARTAPTERSTMRAASAAPPVPVGELQDMLRAGFARFGAEVGEQSIRVAGCESTGDETGQRLNPAARNGDHWGLLQIAWRWHKERAARLGITRPEQLLDPATNIMLAADIFAESRWGPWTCRWAA